MTDEQKIILQILISLNEGNSSYYIDRVKIAISQYDELIRLTRIVGDKK